MTVQNFGHLCLGALGPGPVPGLGSGTGPSPGPDPGAGLGPGLNPDPSPDPSPGLGPGYTSMQQHPRTTPVPSNHTHPLSTIVMHTSVQNNYE